MSWLLGKVTYWTLGIFFMGESHVLCFFATKIQFQQFHIYNHLSNLAEGSRLKPTVPSLLPTIPHSLSAIIVKKFHVIKTGSCLLITQIFKIDSPKKSLIRKRRCSSAVTITPQQAYSMQHSINNSSFWINNVIWYHYIIFFCHYISDSLLTFV